jgi:16S rRNA U1498 N3-methylase RsmE
VRAGGVCTLSEDAAHHAIHMVRLREGEDITLFTAAAASLRRASPRSKG